MTEPFTPSWTSQTNVTQKPFKYNRCSVYVKLIINTVNECLRRPSCCFLSLIPKREGDVKGGNNGKKKEMVKPSYFLNVGVSIHPMYRLPGTLQIFRVQRKTENRDLTFSVSTWVRRQYFRCEELLRIPRRVILSQLYFGRIFTRLSVWPNETQSRVNCLETQTFWSPLLRSAYPR